MRPLVRDSLGYVARLCVLMTVLGAISSIPAFAQLEPARLIGVLTDAQGAVLPGVTVTASSPTLIGTQTTSTETSGKYQFPALPPGTYTLTFELAGFKTFKREGIILPIGKILTVDAQMQLATLEESVTVRAVSPIVDTSTTKVGAE